MSNHDNDDDYDAGYRAGILAHSTSSTSHGDDYDRGLQDGLRDRATVRKKARKEFDDVYAMTDMNDEYRYWELVHIIDEIRDKAEHERFMRELDLGGEHQREDEERAKRKRIQEEQERAEGAKRFQEECFRKAEAVKPVHQLSYTVTVNYHHSLAEMIAAGKYGYCEQNITADLFPIEGTGNGSVTIELSLVHFGCEINGVVGLKSLDVIGLRAASLPELLAFGTTWPDVQRGYPIVALGSLGLGLVSNAAAYLYGDDSRRSLLLSWLNGSWDECFRFAGISKAGVARMNLGAAKI